MANRMYKTLPSALKRGNSESRSSNSGDQSPENGGGGGGISEKSPGVFNGLSHLINGGINFIGGHFRRNKSPSSISSPVGGLGESSSRSSSTTSAASKRQQLFGSSFSRSSLSNSTSSSSSDFLTCHQESIELSHFRSTDREGEDDDDDDEEGRLIETGGDDEEDGIGHRFDSLDSYNPTWCDLCGELIWGLYDTGATKCSHCDLTCHDKCKNKIRLNCSITKIVTHPVFAGLPPESNQDTLRDISELTEDETTLKDVSEIDTHFVLDELPQYDLHDAAPQRGSTISSTTELGLVHDQISSCEFSSSITVTLKDDFLLECIENYNSTFPSGQETVLDEHDPSNYRGFIRVHFNLRRPINVISGTRPPSTYKVADNGTTSLDRKRTGKNTLMSFYLPPETVKALHVTNNTTTRDVIRFLLTKFRVADNPHKYALYERSDPSSSTSASLTDLTSISRNNNKSLGRVKMRRLNNEEHPLTLALYWTRKEKKHGKSFVLQENDPGEIDWESFTLPELKNFLLILDREEAWYKKAIHEKYEAIRNYMERLAEEKKQESLDPSSLL